MAKIESVTTSTKKKGDKFTPSNRPKYHNSEARQKKIKDGIEQLKTYTLNSKNRLPTREEKNSIIWLDLPIERENSNNKK